MKSIVLIALLLHQVLGDGSTELVTRASNEFSNNLYKEVAKTSENVLVCPISLHVALTLVHQGAGGKTASELESVLRLSANADIKESYKSVLTGIKDDTLKIASKLYPAAGYKLNNDFISVAQNYFLSDVAGVDYSNAVAAAGTINKYVEEKTNNKIHNLISPDVLSELTKLVIINAVHFQATWLKTFPSAYEDYFKVTPQEKVKTMMMSQTDYFAYKEDPELKAKVLKMDYSNGGYSMLFILPNDENGLADVEAKLATTRLEDLMKNLQNRKVEVTIPKFKLEQTIQLKDILINMGVKEMFSSAADLHKITNGDSIYVTDVIQKTFINVHENGTEAAAATGIIAVPSSAEWPSPPSFWADHPFLFNLIRSDNGEIMLFRGRFYKPAE